MKKRVPYSILLSLVFLFLLSGHAELAPVLHFDAFHVDSISLTPSGQIGYWTAVEGDGTFALTNGTRPHLVLDSDVAVDFSSFHFFLIARTEPSVAGVVLETLDSSVGLSFFADGKNYRMATGDKQYKKRIGPVQDGGVHLFELSRTIPDGVTRIWPGDYRVDGELCGMVFDGPKSVSLNGMMLWADRPGTVFELLVFDRQLSEKELREQDASLLKKWGIKPVRKKLGEGLSVFDERRVGPEGKYSSFGIYHTSPESPDGKRIAYIVYDEILTKENPGSTFSLWVCDRDLTNHRKVFQSDFKAKSHNGAFQQWMDNDSIVLGGAASEKKKGVDPDAQIVVVNVDTGAIEHGPIQGGFIGDKLLDGKVLMNIVSKSPLGPRGLYQLDINTGEISCIFKMADFASYAGNWSGRDNTDDWTFSHSKHSPSGKRIAFTIRSGSGGPQHLFTSNADGTDVKVWGKQAFDVGADKPLHFLWYDDETMVGVDQCNDDGTPNDLFIKRWDLNGNYIETLGGPGCHLGFSPDKKIFAAENFYRSNPIELFLYRSGEFEPFAKIFEHDGIDVTWTLSGHVNPSFSRDSRRVYYNRPIDDRLKQAYLSELEQVQDEK